MTSVHGLKETPRRKAKIVKKTKEAQTPPYLLRIRTLKREYSDMVEVLLHSAFQCLVDFFEKETPLEHINWESDIGHSKAKKEFTSLYWWWTVGRPAAYKRESELLHIAFFKKEIKTKPIPGKKGLVEWLPFKFTKKQQEALDESHRLEKLLYKKDQENLHRLIDIRGYLWT